MYKNSLAILILIFTVSCSNGDYIAPSFYDFNFNFSDSSATNVNNDKYNNLLKNLKSKGVVGITMSVYHPETGMWIGASGKADLFNNVDMQPCNISRVGSTIKMFTSTVVFLLKEEGKLKLDDKISDYLQGDAINKIENADVATIGQLLQHSSGIYNYIQNLKFQTASLNDLIKEWKPNDLLEYAYHKKAYFSPGQDVEYSNTNYILLGLMIEKIEGKPLFQVFNEKLFFPYHLNLSQFAGENPVPNGIIRGYIDLYSNLQVTESTYFSGWDYFTADGGLISNPYDMATFFKLLMDGKIINATSLNEMLTWKAPSEQNPDFFYSEFGLGIFKILTPQGIVYYHSGDAIGYYANMMYLPKDGSVIVYATNSNYGKIDEFISSKDAIEEILKVTN